MRTPIPESVDRAEFLRLRAAFSRTWVLKLSRMFAPLGLLVGAWLVWVVPNRPLAAATILGFLVGNIGLNHVENRRIPIIRRYHLRVLLNAGPTVLMAVAMGTVPHAWLFALLTMIGGAFAPTVWQGRYIQGVTLGALAATTLWLGVPTDLVATSSLGLMVLAAAMEQTHAALRDAVVTQTLRERAMAGLNTDLEAALESRKLFLATMSHEIRTPMNGVLGMAELLDHTNLDPKQREMVDIIRSSGHGLLQIINDILDLSKLESGRTRAERLPYHPRAVIRDVVELLRNGDQASGLDLRVVHDGVPRRLVGDASRLRQVLLNLVGNAVKFTVEGSVEVRASWADDRLHVAVEDTGPGIAADHIDQIFEPFIQGDSPLTRHHSGTGLGLSICKRLVDLMGGELGVESSVGVGSTFSFDVVAPLAPAESEPATAPIHVVSGMTELDVRVLLVDDNPVNLTVAEAMLLRLGCDVTAVDNATDALELAGTEAFDIVLMDCRMPIMDGFEATRELRARAFDRPILALTAGVTLEEQAICRAAGMDGVLAKPATLRGLREALAQWTTTLTPEDRSDHVPEPAEP